MRKRIPVLMMCVRTAFRLVPGLTSAYLALSVLTASAPAVLAVSLKYVVDNLDGGPAAAVAACCVLAAAAFTLTSIGHEVRHNMWLELSQRVRVEIDREILTLTGSVETVEHLERGEYLDRLALLWEDPYGVSGTPWVLLETLEDGVGLVVSTLLLATAHLWAVLLVVLALPSVFLTTFGERRVQAKRLETVSDTRAEDHLHEVCTQPGFAKEIKVLGSGGLLGRLADERWDRVSRELTGAQARAAVWALLGWSCFAVGYVVLLTASALDAARGRASVGEVVLVVSLAAQIRFIVGQVVLGCSMAFDGFQVIDRYTWLLGYSDGRRGGGGGGGGAELPDRLARGISLRDVSFAYPGTDRTILSHLDLDLPAGSTVAVVGVNGAGKTTLVKLLSGMYRPDSGRILVDGVPLEDLGAARWRTRVSAVYQDFTKFEVRLREAVGIGRLSAVDDDAAVRAALGRAASPDVLAALPSDLDTQLGTSFGGVDLSGGQWQAVAAARALIRPEPLLLILDEPTASLDPQSEYLIYQRYAEAVEEARARCGGVTILISHRFSTVRMADRIVVIDGGSVVEAGTHEELMDADGVYASFYAAQAGSYA